MGRRRGRWRGRGWAAFGGIFHREEGVGSGRWNPQGHLNPLGGLNKGELKTILYVSHKGAGGQGALTLGTEEGPWCWGHREMEGAPIPHIPVPPSTRLPHQSASFQPVCILAIEINAWHCPLKTFLELFTFLYSVLLLLL